MSVHNNSLIPTVAAVLLTVVPGLTSISAGLAAGTCASQPVMSQSTAGRWYYRIDRVNNRKCWYVKELKIDPDTALWLEAALSPKPRVQPTQFSWFSSLAAGLWRPISAEAQPEGTTTDSRLIQTNAAKPLTIEDIIPSEQRIAGVHSSRVLGAELQRKRAPRRILERPDNQPSAQIDQAMRETLFLKFLHWHEQQSRMR
jgi:hypothetical protein